MRRRRSETEYAGKEDGQSTTKLKRMMVAEEEGRQQTALEVEGQRECSRANQWLIGAARERRRGKEAREQCHRPPAL
ncbi:hypothetical protein CBR_g19962 [Chara braunii]|uniref:Uncharacterized protein n=1 Tax=Chara braunii TaxID=69332 RepID=A0A388KZ52_CHABU|nr:hypothetical protein CBR_g19962 [Chara braunii]|eukprot:GBG75329.1 hypothetical protein CBR_g19962 [Chara braunii]